MDGTNLYAPIVSSTLSAETLDNNQLVIPFSVPKVVAPSAINHIQINITKQSDAKPLGIRELYPDGIIYENCTLTGKDDYTTLRFSELEFNGEGLYKIQLRFGVNKVWDEKLVGNPNYPNYPSSFAEWKQQQIQQNAFSEWSAVILFKKILTPTVKILNDTSEDTGSDTLLILGTESTVAPMFYGKYSIKTTDSIEILDQYKFDLYNVKLNTNIEEKQDWPEPLESSGWLQYNASVQYQQESITNGYYNAAVSHRFKNMLVEQGTNDSDYTYSLVFTAKTVNGYEIKTKPYVFIVYPTYIEDEDLENCKFTVIGDSAEYCNENACINLYLEAFSKETTITGNYVIIRSDETSNFTVWEDLKYLFWNQEYFYNGKKLIHQDYTIQSGIRYKYAICFENQLYRRSMPIYHWNEVYGHQDENYSVSIDFQYTYLYHDDIQLKLEFNNSINSFKHSVLASKQDTLGSKFPTILRNGYAYYAEFPISGLITLNMDDNQGFFKERVYISEADAYKNGYYYHDDLIIPVDKYRENCSEAEEAIFRNEYYNSRYGLNGLSYYRSPEDLSTQPTAADKKLNEYIVYTHDNYTDHYYHTFNTNLTDNNIFIERKFREKVEEFLNNGDYKLFKSPTEGNIVVTLMNVTLTPNQTLGRMIYSFNATAYEVAENNLESLFLYQVANKGAHVDEITETDLVVGQIAKNFTGDENISDLIKQEIVNMDIGEGLQYNFKAIKAFWIEQYPKTDFTNQIAELATYKQECIDAIQEIKSKETALTIRDKAIIANYEKEAQNYQDQIDYYKAFQARINQEPTYPTVTMKINYKNVIVPKNRIYYLSNDSVPIDDIYIVPYNNSATISDPTLNKYYKNTKPLIINFIAEAVPSEALELAIADITTIQTWGQMAGVFTDTAAVLERYNGDFRNYPFQVYESILIPPQEEGEYAKLAEIFLTESDRVNGRFNKDAIELRNFELYQSINLLEILQERVRFQVSAEHNINFVEFDFNDSAYIDDTHYEDRWKGIDSNGKTVFLRFDDITEFDIETEPGAQLIIETGYSHDSNENNKVTITVGATGRYTLKPINDAIKTIAFKKPTYALINYKCLNSLIRYGDDNSEVQSNV